MDASKAHRNKVIQGVKCCINENMRNCNACPYLNNCNQLKQDILTIIYREEIYNTDWSGLK